MMALAGSCVAADFTDKSADPGAMPKVPAEFEVQLFAGEPLVRQPCSMAFDAKGRLFVGMGPQYRSPKPETPGDSVVMVLDTDGDGMPLRDKDERNFLEVFGIPPSMSVLRDRFVSDAEKACLKEIDYALIGQMDGLVYRNDRRTRKHKSKLKSLRRTLGAAMKAGAIPERSRKRTPVP